MTLSSTALSGSSSERNARASSTKVSNAMSAIIEREAPVDRVDEVVVLRRRCRPRARRSPRRAPRRARASSVSPPAVVEGSAAPSTSSTAVPSRRHWARPGPPRRARPRTRASVPRHGSARAAGARTSIGEQGARADARALERCRPVAGVAAAAERVDVGLAGLEPGGGEDERRPGRPPRRRRRTSGAGPRARAQRVHARLAWSSVRMCGQSSRLPAVTSTTGSSVSGHEHADQRDEHPAVADRAQERHRQRRSAPAGRWRPWCR